MLNVPFISVNQRNRFSGWRAENIAPCSCDALMAGKRYFVCRRKCYSYIFFDSTHHLLLSAAIVVSPISLSGLLSLSLSLSLSISLSHTLSFLVHPSPSALSA